MDIKEYTEKILDERKQLPHCDMFVLHRQKTCQYCDDVPELQQFRIDNGINFTNENDPNLKDCPSWEHRSQETIERWHGNIPFKDLRDE